MTDTQARHNDINLRHRENLLNKKENGEHLIGVAAGSGMTGKYSVMGGCDMLLALSSGKYRSMGCGSLAGYMCYANSNDMVMDFAGKELLRFSDRVPVFFGLDASDPTKNIYDFIKEIKNAGFSGIVNYPTIGLIDGNLRSQLEADGSRYEKEVEAVSFAHYCGLLTIAYVFDTEQAAAMINAGADIICAHFGLTSGGYIGAQKVLSLEKARMTAKEIFSLVDKEERDIIKMVYGGPVKTPVDADFIYNGSNCDGYIGGSVFERTPVEAALVRTVQSFKDDGPKVPRTKLEQILFNTPGQYDCVEFMLEYIRENYMNSVKLEDLASTLHFSPSYMSTVFKNRVGVSFQHFLIDLRMKKAREYIHQMEYSLIQISQMVGYQDYAQFSKMYKKAFGVSPGTDLQNIKKTQEKL